MFKVYTGPSGTERLSPLDKASALFKGFESLDDAFAWAVHASKAGHSVLLIEGDDGTQLTKPEIAVALRHRAGRVASNVGVG